MKQMFIENKPKAGFFSFIGGLFATHPPIEKRIAILERGISVEWGTKDFQFRLLKDIEWASNNSIKSTLNKFLNE